MPRFDQIDSIRNRLRLHRHPAHSIDPATLLGWLWRFKHPRIVTIGIDSNRWGRKNREVSGLVPHGTVWWEGPVVGDRTTGESIPANSIVYDSRTTAKWNEETTRWEDGEMMRGWRRFLLNLTKDGILYPCDDLTYLLGQDSWGECPRKYWE